MVGQGAGEALVGGTPLSGSGARQILPQQHFCSFDYDDLHN